MLNIYHCHLMLNAICSWNWLTKYRICTCISRTFFYKNLPSKIGVRLIHKILWRFNDWARDAGIVYCETPVETACVWDCYLASYCTRANAPTYYRCTGIFSLHKSSQHHQFPEVGRPWHIWRITGNAARDNQIAANAIANTFTQVKSSAAYIRVVIIFKFLT
jgi:hypothetical protein